MTHYGEENGCDCSKLKRIRERVNEKIEMLDGELGKGLLNEHFYHGLYEAYSKVLAIIDEEGK